LEISGLFLPNITDQIHFKAYVFFPQAVITDGPVCPEFLGTYNFVPHIGQALYNPNRVWRAAVGPKLKALGLDFVNHVVFTIVQTGKPQILTFQKARIIYDLSPEVAM
jgi:polyphenol oxidase